MIRMTEENFKPPYIRNKQVIKNDIAYAETLLKNNPNNSKLKEDLKELYAELNYTKPSFIERLIGRRK